MCDFGRLVAIDKRPIAERRGFSALKLPPPYYGVVLSVGQGQLNHMRARVCLQAFIVNECANRIHILLCMLVCTAFNNCFQHTLGEFAQHLKHE